MRFGQYLHDNRISVADAAKALGMLHETVRRYARGERIPRNKAMAAIAEWTEGEVTADDFYEIDESKRRKNREAA